MTKCGISAIGVVCVAISALLIGCPPSNKAEIVMLPGDVPLEMVWIEPGTFMMGTYFEEQGTFGNPATEHEITLTQGFWIGKYEVTIGQYLAFLRGTGVERGVDWEDSQCPITRSSGTYALRGNTFGQTEAQPMIELTWNAAEEFSAWVASVTGKTFRLPTEAEWEYACRAGTETRFYWGDDPRYAAIGDYAWYSANSDGRTHDVGQKLPNAWGLYDMSGNVAEYCNDRFHVDYYSRSPSIDPPGSASGAFRMNRGGGYDYVGNGCRSAGRGATNPIGTQSYRGFRLAQ